MAQCKLGPRQPTHAASENNPVCFDIKTFRLGRNEFWQFYQYFGCCAPDMLASLFVTLPLWFLCVLEVQVPFRLNH